MRINKQLKSINKFIPIIEEQSKRFGVEKNLLLGIAILENINRPSWIRIFEKVIYKYFPIKTFGLMQVKSYKYLDDKRSIKSAAKLIASLSHENNPIKLGEMYNGSKEYGLCLSYIVSELRSNDSVSRTKITYGNAC